MGNPTLSDVLRSYQQAAAEVEYEEFMDEQHKASTMRHALALLKKATPALEWLGYTAPFHDMGLRVIFDSTCPMRMLVGSVSRDANAGDDELLRVRLVPDNKIQHTIGLKELLTVYYLATGVEL